MRLTSNKNSSLLFVLIAFLFSCNKPSQKGENFQSLSDIKIDTVPKHLLTLKSTEGKWYFNDKPFNGLAVKFHSNDIMAEKTEYVNGKREGETYSFFSNGNIKKRGSYKNNKLNGSKISYYNNGAVFTELNYQNGTLHGIQKTWYPNGQLSKRRNLEFGKEVGFQKAWLENGKLYVNYEVVNGRVYGLRRANSCFKLENEIVVKDEKI